MTSKQRIMAALNGDPMDRIPITEIGVWPETEERWRKEGLPEGISVEDYFGLDKMSLFTFDGSLMLPYQQIEKNNQFEIYVDGNGCKYKKFIDGQKSPQLLAATIDNLETWGEVRGHLTTDMKRFYEVSTDLRFGTPIKQTMQKQYDIATAEDTFKVLSPTEPCWFYLQLLGEEEALVNMALEPDFVEQVISDYTDFNIKMIQEILDHGYTFDALWVFSDLAYKNGLLFSPEFFKSRVAPYQKKMFDFAKENKMKIIYHCDGDVSSFIPLLIDVGVECMQPLEARQANDVRVYIEKFGDKLSYIGNINADALSLSKEAIYKELTDKIPVAMKSNRYIYHSDHSIPDTVSFEHFKYAIELAKKLGTYE